MADNPSTRLGPLIEAQRQESFTDPSTATDEEALGILIANYLEWAGDRIMLTAAAALEDANFHTEAAMLEKMAST